MDGRIADNAGYQPIDVTIQQDGETAYFTSLPVKAMVQSIKDAGIPSALSYTAGSYVCNYLMYTLLYLIDKKYPNIRGGFIHVPYAMEQAGQQAPGHPQHGPAPDRPRPGEGRGGRCEERRRPGCGHGHHPLSTPAEPFKAPAVHPHGGCFFVDAGAPAPCTLAGNRNRTI
mgnify:FL=1